MSILNLNLSANETVIKSGIPVLETNAYKATVAEVFHYVNSKGTDVVSLALNFEDFGEIVYNLYLSSKGTHLTKNGKPMQGFVVFNQLKQAILGTDQAQVTLTPSIKKIRENEQNGSLIKQLVGFPITVGIVKKIENKQELVNGIYQNTNDKREFNEIAFIANAEGKLLKEVQSGTEAEFLNDWVRAKAGTVVDNFKAVATAIKPTVANATASTTLPF